MPPLYYSCKSEDEIQNILLNTSVSDEGSLVLLSGCLSEQPLVVMVNKHQYRLMVRHYMCCKLTPNKFCFDEN